MRLGRQEEGGEENRVFRIVIGAIEVVSDLKSSRCGSGLKKMERQSYIK